MQSDDDAKAGRTLYIRDIPPNYDDQTFLSIVQSFGQVTNSKFCGHFAFVEYDTAETTRVALDGLTQMKYDGGTTMTVMPSRTAIKGNRSAHSVSSNLASAAPANELAGECGCTSRLFFIPCLGRTRRI
jgi:hypothetical protein